MQSVASAADFDEAFYLETYPDIARSVADGEFTSGQDHYLRHGRAEGRLGMPKGSGRTRAALFANFDEQWYLAEYPDVEAGIAAGHLASGYDHWQTSGKAEGRIAPPGYDEGREFDAEWYLGVYHGARADIEAGRAPDALSHYERLGRHRGYLPNRFAPRPDNPAGPASRFGGLWLDNGNALDLIAGRMELGRITRDQATMLERFVADGYVILRGALAPETVERASDALRQAYAGEIKDQLFECPKIGGYNPIHWDGGVRNNPAKALDMHWLSQDIRDLIFAPPVREVLELIFERRAMATQSLAFLLGSAQGYHQDTLYVPYSLPTQFVASWIALEDVQLGGGELTYFTGSHRLPELLFKNRYKTLWDAQRMLRRHSLREETASYSDRLATECREAGFTEDKFMAKKGDVLIWHADLAHGGLPISKAATRSSVVTHYCPKEVASLTFERGTTAIRSHNDVAWYATGYYAAT